MLKIQYTCIVKRNPKSLTSRTAHSGLWFRANVTPVSKPTRRPFSATDERQLGFSVDSWNTARWASIFVSWKLRIKDDCFAEVSTGKDVDGLNCSVESAILKLCDRQLLEESLHATATWKLRYIKTFTKSSRKLITVFCGLAFQASYTFFTPSYFIRNLLRFYVKGFVPLIGRLAYSKQISLLLWQNFKNQFLLGQVMTQSLTDRKLFMFPFNPL